jgi:methyl-CpG-binding domain protein 4
VEVKVSPPPRSPFGLIQEDIWPNGWAILVVCIFLNQTQRKQVEKVLPEFLSHWPTPEKLLAAQEADVKELIRPLGFYNRRYKNLVGMSKGFTSRNWSNIRELEGVGEYAARSYEIFCEGKLGAECPNDHALIVYWKWRIRHGG